MKRTVLALAVAVVGLALVGASFFGGRAQITSLHPTTNFLWVVMSADYGAPARLISFENLLTQLIAGGAGGSITVAQGTNIVLVTNGTIVTIHGTSAAVSGPRHVNAATNWSEYTFDSAGRYIVTNALTTNVVMQLTNFVDGASIVSTWIGSEVAGTNFTLTVASFGGAVVHWLGSANTNGTYDILVPSQRRVSLAFDCEIIPSLKQTNVYAGWTTNRIAL